MNYVLSLLLTIGLFASAMAQTWSNEVAPIFYNKCTSCHHNGGIAPFPLMTYAETANVIGSIYDVVAQDKMPPWPPDNGFQQYSHTRSLTSTEKSTILSWLTAGGQEGNASNTPPLPVYNNQSVLGNGDMVIKMPNYRSKAQSGNDDYVCFALPTGLTQDRKIRALEVIPGNRSIVHHALIYVDETASYQTDTTGGNCGGPQNANLITGYTPGASPLVFPSGSSFKLGMKIPAGSNLVFAMHYPNGSYGILDSTKVIIHFYPVNETGVREVFAAAPLQNWNLALPPNQQTTANAVYPANGTTNVNLSVLSTFPHMHNVGKSIKSYALSPQNDTIPFINIPHWDFHWQDFYFFKNIQKVPIGSRLYVNAVYDNTSSNPHNPNNPPQWVFAGENTSDEMLMVYFHYLLYQPGDELIDLESLLNLGIPSSENTTNEWVIYPQPAATSTHIIPPSIAVGDQVSLFVYDGAGRLIRKLMENTTITQPFNGIEWDGKNDAGQTVTTGVYYLSLNKNGVMLHSELMR